MSADPDKPRFAREAALTVVRELLPLLSPACAPGGPGGKTWLTVAGSLRRGRVDVGDIEIVYVPAFGDVQDGLFTKTGNLFDAVLDELLANGTLAKRKNTKGSEMWGDSNKLAVHFPTGIPIDFFAIAEARFWNYLVCRTGGKENNTLLAMAAEKHGLKWHPYRGGFEVLNVDLAREHLTAVDLYTGKLITAQSEEDVYRLAGLPYLKPTERR